MMWVLCGVLIACGKRSKVETNVVAPAAVEWQRWWQHENVALRARSIEVAVAAGLTTSDDVENLWQDSTLFVRERLAYQLWQQGDIKGLQHGWSVPLTDQERCRLALQLSAIGDRDNVLQRVGVANGQWNPFASGSLEDRWTCALAAQELLGIQTKVADLIEQGDFPLSMPWMLDVLYFASDALIRQLQGQVDWFEEGLRAPFLTVLRMRDVSFQERYQIQSASWTAEECLDAVDMVWMNHQTTEVQFLTSVVAPFPSCVQWFGYANVAISGQGFQDLKQPLTSLYSARDDLSGALRALGGSAVLSPRQQRRLRSWLHPRLRNEVEPTILPDVADSIAHWGNHETLKIIYDLRLSALEPQVQFELQLAGWRLHHQLMKVATESNKM